MVCLAVLHSQGIHPKCCASLRQQKALGHYLLSKASCQIMMGLHGAREVRYMSPQDSEIMVRLAQASAVLFHILIWGPCGLSAGAPQVVTTSSGAFVTSFMTDEDTSLHMW
jgi:hypothetical protein